VTVRRSLKWLAVVLLIPAIGALALAVLTEWELSQETTLAIGTKVDRIVVHKSRHEMVLIAEGARIRLYKVALGGGGPGPKMQEGDRKTPEGLYRINGRNPNSAFHLSLRISYPEQRDIEAARARGVSPGGDIMIHGLPNGGGWIGDRHRLMDWTAGCIAVTNAEFEELWRVIKDGTPIEILP